MPFISEEIYKNLTDDNSVHLTDYPLGDKSLLDDWLVKDMIVVRKIAEIAHAKRKEAGIRLRQPLQSITYKLSKQLDSEIEKILAEELNIKAVEYQKSSSSEPKVELDTRITRQLAQEGEARELIRQVQQLRKEQNLTLADKTRIEAPNWPKAYEGMILLGTASVKISRGDKLKVKNKANENSSLH